MCGDCGENAVLVRTREANMVCTGCGMVVDGCLTDEGPEWFDAGSSRAGLPGRDDAVLRDITNNTNNTTYRSRQGRQSSSSLMRYGGHGGGDPDRAVRLGLREVERCASSLRIDADHNICGTGKRIYADYATARKASNRTVRESERPAAAACALYFGCKTHERESGRYPRTIKEIAGHCGVDVAECTDLMKSFKTVLKDAPYHKLLFTTVKADDLFLRAVQSLRLERPASNDVLKKAREVFVVVTDKNLLEGRTPETVCSAVVFRAAELAGVKVTRKAVYESCGITGVTMGKALEILKSHV